MSKLKERRGHPSYRMGSLSKLKERVLLSYRKGSLSKYKELRGHPSYRMGSLSKLKERVLLSYRKGSSSKLKERRGHYRMGSLFDNLKERRELLV